MRNGLLVSYWDRWKGLDLDRRALCTDGGSGITVRHWWHCTLVALSQRRKAPSQPLKSQMQSAGVALP